MGLFRFRKTYDKNLYNHIKGGVVGQIVNLVLFIVFAGLALLCEWWSIGMYGENFGLGILTSIITIGFISFIVQTGFTNTAVCFKSTVVAIYESIAAKIDDKIFEKQMAQNGQNPELARQKLEEIKAKRKPTSKGLNIFLGIAYLLLTLLFIGLVVFCFFHFAIPTE